MDNSNIIITDNDTLKDFYNKCIKEKVLAIDTEFIRENSYYPSLCLVQIAGESFSAAIDPLSGIDMKPVWDLLANESILKVFHAARQDLEIFFNLTGKLPKPIYDTQIASMFCGLGDQVGYEKLVSRFLGKSISKENQFTNWLQRPLSQEQLNYAICDVTYLIKIYPIIKKLIGELEREDWVKKELQYLNDKSLYVVEPSKTWEKIKVRQSNGEMLNYLKDLASWREVECQKRNIPRNWLIRDDTLVNIAILKPQKIEKLKKIRGVSKNLSDNDLHQILKTIKKSSTVAPEYWPQTTTYYKKQDFDKSSLELLKLLLMYCSERSGLAERLIASSDDLRQILSENDKNNKKLFNGWRNEIFGKYVKLLLEGKLAFTIMNKKIKKINF